MNRLATIALSIAGMFLTLMAILVNSPPLFYMTVAVLATLGASRLQAYLAVRGLRFERTSPPSVGIGETVSIETVVWSEMKLRRPLVTVEDILPGTMVVVDRTAALPVAPAFDQPIKTRFTFRPLRRGRFRWRNVLVKGTDALGLVVLEKKYSIEPIELTVYPTPIPVSLDIRPSYGHGTTDLDSGVVKGAGIDPRGIREYAHGDPIRHVHWKSTARTGRLMVKEFDSGSGLSLAMTLQRTAKTDVGPPGGSTFEVACGHALFLALNYIERGATVWFPGMEREDTAQGHADARSRAVREVLTDIQPIVPQTISDEISRFHLRSGTTLMLLLSVQDPNLPVILPTLHGVRKVCLIYDALAYDPECDQASAAEYSYLAQLEAAGAEIHLMPLVEPFK